MNLPRNSLTALCLVAGLLMGAPVGRALTAPAALTYSEEQKGWALGTCGVLTQVNKRDHRLLGGELANDKNVAATKKSLERWWGVQSREQLLTVLLWIDREGHRKEFDAVAKLTPEQLATITRGNADDPETANKLAIARETAPALGAKSLVGWDFSRYVMLCGWSVVAGYMTEDEAWARIMPVARKLQATFMSWDDLGQNYLIGRRYWSREMTEKNGADYTKAVQWLETDPGSPWKRYAWNLNLDSKPAGPSASPTP